MMLDIPFYKNDQNGLQCLQVTMRTVIKYFLDKDLSLKELDKITGRHGHYWTWVSQIVPELYDLGLDVKYYSIGTLEELLQGEPFIREYYGEDAEKILKNTELPVLIESVKKLIKHRLYEKRKLSFSDIEEHIRKGHVPLVMFDNNTLMGKDDLYQGHFVVLTGFDDEHVYYHESGPTNPMPNKKVPKEKFIKAMNAKAADNDVVMVFGKR